MARRRGYTRANSQPIAGPKTETGYHLPVRIEFRREPWGPYGAESVMCFIRGGPVGYLDPRKIRADPTLQLHLEEALLSGRPVVVDGCIVGGWSRDGGTDQGEYEVRFGRDFGDDPLDADMKELLELDS